MSTSTRSSRRPQSQPPLSSLESLLLAQATWELGAAPASWLPMSKLLSKHPLLSRPKSFFNAQSCHSMYETLMKDAGLELNEANNPPHAANNLKLAQKHYQIRLKELRDLILEEETKFKTVLQEIEEISTGQWDKKIEAKIKGEPLTEQEASGSLSQEGAIEQEQERAQPENAHLQSVDGVDENTVDSNQRRSETLEEADAGAKDGSPDESEDVDMKELEAVQQATTAEDDVETAQPQEEEEDSGAQERTREEEEEAASNRQSEPVDVEGTGDAETSRSPKSGRHTDETESEPRHTPAAPTPGGDDDGRASEEPVVATRRSTRQRKSSGAPAPAPLATRQRRGKVKVESQPPESDNEDTEGNTPAREGDRMSSPFDTGAPRKRDGKRKASYVVDNVDSPQDKKRMREDSEAGDDDEPGPSSHNTRARAARNATRTEEQKRFQNVISMLHSQISQHRNGTIFHNPIKPSEAPDYQEIVKRPMDLKTIKTRVKDGIIANSLEFQRDIYLMFANAMMYNRPGSDVHGMTEDMMVDSETQINAHRQTEGMVKRRP